MEEHPIPPQSPVPPILPYAALPVPPVPTEPKPPYALYTHKAVGLATFFGTPIAGTALMAMNYSRLGRKRLAWWAIGLGLLGTIVTFAIAMVVPTSWPLPLQLVPALVGLFAVMAIAESLQGKDVKQHVRRGGDNASMWKATGIGLISLVVVLGVFVGLSILMPGELSKKINATPVEAVYYTKDATQADAVKLGDLLKSAGFFNGQRAKSVVLTRSSSGTRVKFVVGEGVWDKPEIIDAFRSIGKGIAAGLGSPLTVLLCDKDLNVKKEIKIE
jgi:hypothetical protein